MREGKRGVACVFRHEVGRLTFSVRGRPSGSEHMGDGSHDHDMCGCYRSKEGGYAKARFTVGEACKATPSVIIEC